MSDVLVVRGLRCRSSRDGVVILLWVCRHSSHDLGLVQSSCGFNWLGQMVSFRKYLSSMKTVVPVLQLCLRRAEVSLLVPGLVVAMEKTMLIAARNFIHCN